MNSPLAIALLLLAIVCAVIAIGKFAVFWKKMWLSHEFDFKSLVLTVISGFVFISVFFYMKENPEALNIKVNQANSSKQADKKTNSQFY